MFKPLAILIATTCFQKISSRNFSKYLWITNFRHYELLKDRTNKKKNVYKAGLFLPSSSL